MAKLYITTTIPYVNAEPHIGHALEFVQADVIARYHREGGDEVYFLSGTDENAIKNVQAAEQAGIAPREFVDRNSQLFRELLRRLNVSTDQFIRTTEERHVKGAQALFRATNPEDIYKKKYKGLYCVGCELFYKPDELNDKGRCAEHPTKELEVVEEENYFFRLSKYEGWLKGLIQNGELSLVPETRKNETLSLIKGGLEDFSISRPVSRSKKWGVPVPDDPSQTIYVWYDALANYITALGYPDVRADLYQKFWAAQSHKLHVLGKGVSRFHAVYWPAILKSAGLPLPTEEFIHGYITVDGQKISKTAGNTVNPLEVINRYGTDAVRYYLLREIPSYEDGDFSYKKLEGRYRGDLANGLGNFASRVLTLGGKEGGIKEVRLDHLVDEAVRRAQGIVREKLTEFRFHEALAGVWELISFGDGYVNERKPWESGDREAIGNLMVLLDHVATLVAPFLPETSEKIKARVGWEDGVLKVKKGKGEVLFPRLS